MFVAALAIGLDAVSLEVWIPEADLGVGLWVSMVFAPVHTFGAVVEVELLTDARDFAALKYIEDDTVVAVVETALAYLPLLVGYKWVDSACMHSLAVAVVLAAVVKCQLAVELLPCLDVEREFEIVVLKYVDLNAVCLVLDEKRHLALAERPKVCLRDAETVVCFASDVAS